MPDTRFQGRSALVIEDEVFTRLVLAKMLASLGFAPIHQAADGGTGLDLAQAHRVDVVLCDIEMQPVDGFAVLAGLQATQTAAPPVVFLTGHAQGPRVEQAQAMGCAVLSKPAHAEALAQTLAAALA